MQIIKAILILAASVLATFAALALGALLGSTMLWIGLALGAGGFFLGAYGARKMHGNALTLATIMLVISCFAIIGWGSWQ